jgi:copper chaperone
MIKKFNVNGMTCSHCVMAVEKELAKLDIDSLKVEIGDVEVDFDPEKLSEEKITNAIKNAGYSVVASEQENK